MNAAYQIPIITSDKIIPIYPGIKTLWWNLKVPWLSQPGVQRSG